MTRRLAALALVLAVTLVHAQEKKPSRKEERAAVCTAQADDRNLEGATRGAYMRQCLKGGRTEQFAAQQEKILECTEEADGQSLTPREHRRFMTRCLRG